VNKQQSFAIDVEGSLVIVSVVDFHFVEEELDASYALHKTFGIIDGDTEFIFRESQRSLGKMRIKTTKLTENIILKDFNFEKLGIGGLDKEFSDIFRRAFNSRRYPPAILQQYGIKHVKGKIPTMVSKCARNAFVWSTWNRENFNCATNCEGFKC
jgi:hypothetical protein